MFAEHPFFDRTSARTNIFSENRNPLFTKEIQRQDIGFLNRRSQVRVLPGAILPILVEKCVVCGRAA